MKNLVILAALAAVSCTTQKTMVQKSDVAITTADERVLYIKDGPIGSNLYATWVAGAYGTDIEVHLISEAEFEKMKKKTR